MPGSLSINSYPLALYSTVESVLLTRQPASFVLPTEKAAKRLRFQVYGLRKALEASEEHPLSLHAPKLSTELTGAVLTIFHADESPTAKLLEGA